MHQTPRRRSLLLSLHLLPLLSMGVVGCSGTRLYERANGAATAGDYPHAIAYDTLAARERSAQPPTFDQQYSDHVARYVAQVFAHLGPADLANADAQRRSRAAAGRCTSSATSTAARRASTSAWTWASA